MSLHTDFVPFARPELGSDEEAAVLRVLRSGWLTTGREAQLFEQEFREYCGVAHSLAVSSATAGLHLALEALGVRPGDRVAVSPYTFAASAEVIRYLDADPVFVDIEPHSFNIDTQALERVLAGGAVRAVMPVHIGGYPCDTARIRRLAAEYGAVVVEDAAHTFPAREPEEGPVAGTGSDAGVFSFYATKTITTGEGGMLVCHDRRVAERAEIMRLHGIDRPVWDRYRARNRSHEYEVVAPGYKYNLPDLLAAIGRVQLRRAAEFQARREAIAARYLEALRDCEEIELPPDDRPQSWHLFLLRLRLERLTIGRDGFITQLSEAGVGSSVHYRPLHLMPYYRDRYGLSPSDFPVSLDTYERCLSLPIYPGLRDEELERVVAAVRSICRKHARG